MQTVKKIINAVSTSDGDGVKIKRIGGRALNTLLDPFLMIDEINSDESADYIGGFPEHPHRGFETITYMKAGRMRHRDHMGNEGVISAGDVQWMTAGRGVLHSEMPEQDNGLLHGFQIWLNLPAKEKMKAAAYCDIPSNSIAELVTEKGSLVRAIAGNLEADGVALAGTLPKMSTQPMLLDIELQAGDSVELTFKHNNPARVFVYQGALQDGARKGQLQVYSGGDSLRLKATAKGAKLLLISGKALREPIVQHGPFVMNSAQQIELAVRDYHQGRLV